MLDFLYSLPNWLVGVTVTGSLVAVSVAAHAIFNRFVRFEFSADDRALAVAMLAVLATINSLLLAFSAVSVWESFAAAEESVVQEADTMGKLGRDLAVYDTPESHDAREGLRRYARLVIDKEWDAMRTGGASPEAWTAADDVFRAIGRMDAETPRHQALLPEIWARTNELVGHRRDRLYDSQAEVPGTLWAVVLTGTALTLLTIFMLPPTRFNHWMVAVLAFAMGLVFFFIIAMDRPFAGKESISSAPFQSALDNMRRWDSR